MKKTHLLLIYICLISFVKANQIDIGIFTSISIPKKIEVFMRPDFNISSIQTVTGILYTVRWDDPAITITTQSIYPFFVAPQGTPVLSNGYYYQVFAAVPMIAMAMNANQEYLMSSFTYTNGDCAIFQIIEDEWTQANNGNVYFELVGIEVTGIIYHADVLFGSIGGNIVNSGGDTTYLGTSTGTMTLSGYNGIILSWQRKVNEGSWENIPGTGGLELYSEIPPTIGDYFYQVNIQNGFCPIAVSGIFNTVVVAEINMNLIVLLEGAFDNTIMTTHLNDNGLIPLSQPYSSPPWNYTGNESVTSIPQNVVDWILIEFRESEGDASTATADKSVHREAAFVMMDGTIKDIDGQQNLKVALSLNDNLYIVVSHRNHLAVISAAPPLIVNWNCYYDFSSGENQALGGTLGHKEIGTGIWGMRAGDADSDGLISNTDKDVNWNSEAGSSGYFSPDFSMDSQVDNKDKNDLWYPNRGSWSHVPE
jgi:hypothetical protein